MLSLSAWVALLNMFLCVGLALRTHSAVLTQWSQAFIRLMIFLGLDMFVQFLFQSAETEVRAAFWLGGKSVTLLSLVGFFDLVLTISTDIRPLSSRFAALRKVVWALAIGLLLVDGILWADAVRPQVAILGWTRDYTQSSLAFILTHTLFLSLTLSGAVVLIFRAWRFAQFRRQRQMVNFVILAGIIPGLIGTGLAYYQHYQGMSLTDFTLPLITVGIALISFGLFKYQLVHLSPRFISDRLLHEIPNMLFLLDKDQRMVAVNAQVQAKLGWQESDWLGKPFESLAAEGLSPDWPQRAQIGIKVNLLHRHDKPVPISLTLVRVGQGPLEEAGSLCIGTDLSELQNYRRKLQHTHQQLQSSATDLQHLTRAAFHDLREPLRTISNFAQLIRRLPDKPNAKTDQYLSFVEQGVSHMEHQLQGLSMLLTIRQHSPRFERLNWRLMAERLWLSLADKQPSATFYCQGPAMIRADRFLLEIILMELLRNATEHTHTTRNLNLRLQFTQNEGEQVFELKDNGKGMPIWDTSNLGNLNQMQSLLVSPNHTKAGFGLSLVKAALDMCDAHINIHSTPEAGTRVTLTFPLAIHEPLSSRS